MKYSLCAFLKTIHAKAYTLLLSRLKEARKSAGVSQQALAASLGMPQSFVSKYENGERRLDVLELICITESLDIDICKLLGQFRETVRLQPRPGRKKTLKT